MSFLRHKRHWIVALLSAALCSACSRAPRTTLEAGAFRILRTQHSYGNWNTGGTTTYYAYDVTYRRGKFEFDGFFDLESPERFESRQIARAYVVSDKPAALMVLAGDPNNHASWNLLVDTPQGLRAEHVAFHADGSQLAWLDGDTPSPIAEVRELLRLEGGRQLWVEQQALLDIRDLTVLQLQTPARPREGAQFVMFSPDRRSMLRYTTRTDPANFHRWYPILLVNDLRTGAQSSLDIDPQTMWFDDNRDIDAAFVSAYFQWVPDGDAGQTLQRRSMAGPRPYRGRFSREQGSGALHYHVPRLRFEQRRAAMDLIAASLGATYVLPEPDPPPPPAPAADPTASAVSAPPFGEPLVRADLSLQEGLLSIYFSERGLSIENHEPSLDSAVQAIGELLDARLWLSSVGLSLISTSTPSGDNP